MSTLRHELKELEGDLDRLNSEQDECTVRLTDKELSHEARLETSTQLAKALEQMEVLEERWLVISEEIEGRG
jgi:hypothetical protein